ncbi:MAG TPA: type IV secretion system protein [Rickettsiales bacterium]|nr:type IV secretion system protein [Rickettsiales bacterium]
MNGLFSVFRFKSYNLFFLIFIFLLFPYVSNASECVYAKDTGNVFTVTVSANPDLTVDNKYSDEGVSQRAAWTDTGLYTSGDPFYFEIEGMWSPWSATFDMIGGDDENASSYTGLKTKTTDAFFCYLNTKNEGTDEIGYNGEFDYISSLMDVTGDSYPYTSTMKPSYTQSTCWLTAGEGLYIGFFGTTGNDLPTLATHLKSANILCDSEYLKDKNNDGVFTLNECVRSNSVETSDSDSLSTIVSNINAKFDNTNMAYYEIGTARCESEFMHETEGLPDDAIGINDCYQDVTYSSGDVVREDKTLFIFDANYLYKNIDLDKVGKNENIRFVIYDSYYTDNVGQYTVYMYSGVTDNSDKGLIEKIITDLEEVFIGSRDSSGVLSNGYLMTFYNYIVSDTEFAFVVRVAATLYMAFLGLSFALGSLEYTIKELMKILLKLTFVLSFTTSTSWELYDRFVIQFFYDGFAGIVSMFGNISLLMSDSSASVSTGTSMASKFAFIDNMILSLFSDSITKKIWGLFFGVWYGFIVIPIIYVLIIYYIYQLVNAVFPYIVMFIQAILALFLGPIFISFSLFNRTEFMFKAWLNFVGGRFANMMFLFLSLFLFWLIIQEQFNSLLYFNSCKVPLLQAIFTDNSDNSSAASMVASFFSIGIPVWDANWDNVDSGTPSFLSFCLSLLFLYIIIYLFGIIMKKIPTIVDSMFTIGGERAGGGLNFEGESRFGRIGGFFDNVDRSIKIGTGEFKNGKEVKKGLFQYLGDKQKQYTKAGVKRVGSSVLNFGSNLTYKPVRTYISGKFIKSNVKDSGLKGKYAVNEAVTRYEEELKKAGYSKFNIEEKSAIFKEEMSEYFLSDARKNIEKRSRELSNTFKEVSDETGLNPGITERSKIIKAELDSYVKNNFDQDFDGKSYYYSFNTKSIIYGVTEIGMSSSVNDVLSFEDLTKFKRDFSLKEKSLRYGQNYKTFDDYQKDMDMKIRTMLGMKNENWLLLAKEKYWTAIEESNRIEEELKYNANLINNPEELENANKILRNKLEITKKETEDTKLSKEDKRTLKNNIKYYIEKIQYYDEEDNNKLIKNSLLLEKELETTIDSVKQTDNFIENYNKINTNKKVTLYSSEDQLSSIPGLIKTNFYDMEKPLGFENNLDNSIINSENFKTVADKKNYKELYYKTRLQIGKQQLKILQYEAALITDKTEKAKFIKEIISPKEEEINNIEANLI